MKKILLLILVLMLVALVIWPIRISIFAQHDGVSSLQPLVTSGSWDAHNYDLVYTVAFSSEVQPNGPLVVYRAPATDLRSSVPVIAIARSALPPTPLFFPSPNGQYLALLAPVHVNGGTSLNGSALSVLSTDGHGSNMRPPIADGAGIGDQVIWSANSRFLYYQKVIETSVGTGTSKGRQGLPIPQKGHPQGAPVTGIQLRCSLRFLIPAWVRIRICARIFKRAILRGMRRRICWLRMCVGSELSTFMRGVSRTGTMPNTFQIRPPTPLHSTPPPPLRRSPRRNHSPILTY